MIDLRKRRPGIRHFTREIPFRREREPLRARRQKLRALAVFALLVILAGSLYGLSQLSYSPKLLINNVSVVGAEDVPPKVVRAYVETKLNDGTNPILSRQNILLYPRAFLEQSIIKYFPRIKGASISRESMLAQAIIVSVEERQPFALWCKEIGNRHPPAGGGNGNQTAEKECFDMDDTGFIYATALPLSGKAYMIFGGGLPAMPSHAGQAGLVESTSPITETFLPENFGGVLELIKNLRQAGFAPQGAIVENEKDFSVQFDEGFVMHALFNEDANTLVRNLQLALSSDPLRGKVNKLEYIDLRFGNRVYYKNKSL